MVTLSGEDRKEFLKVVHSAVVEKPSSITHFYDKSALISVIEIEQIYIKFDQIFDRYDKINMTFSCEVSMDTGEILRYSSFDEFKSIDENQSSSISSIDIEFICLIQHKASTKASSFKIEIGFRKIPEMISGYFSNLPRGIVSPIRLQIEFGDYVIARMLKSVSDDWVESLEVVEINRNRKLFRRFFVLVDKNSINAIGISVSIGALLSYQRDFFIVDPIYKIFIFVSLYFILRLIDAIVSSTYRMKIISESYGAGFRITKGDRNEITKKSQDDQSVFILSIGVLFGIVLNIFIGIASAWFVKILF